MRYALLIYANEQDWATQTEEQSQAQFQGYMAFTKDIVDRGMQQAGEALQPTSTATTVRVKNGETVTTDGPFAETKEQLGGFYIVECKDLDEAIEVAAKIPDARSGSIEVRPVLDTDMPS
ncbi:MAG TPA: YciI family protein [Actinomycetes bacterium]|nr:YciI family protein [Actinomycetes bacterium]